MTKSEKNDLVYSLLKNGVPPTAIAKTLELDVDHVRGALAHMRAEKYGTDEISEAMTNLIWEAYQEALYQIKYGSPTNKVRFIQMVLARSVGIAGRADTDAGQKVRDALMAFASAEAPAVMLGDSIYTPTE